jgi:hypothetical protein
VKKILFNIIVIILPFVSKANSQLIHSYGLKTGITNAKQDWKYTGSFLDIKIFEKSRLGIDFGGFIEWLNSPTFNIVTEMHYIQKGCKDEIEITTIEEPSGTGEIKSIDPRIDYLSFPLLAKICYNNSKYNIYIISGYRIDFIVNKNRYASGSVFDDLNSYDNGPIIGFGINFTSNFIYKIGCEFRYNHSYQNIFSSENLSVKNKTMNILLTLAVL